MNLSPTQPTPSLIKALSARTAQPLRCVCLFFLTVACGSGGPYDTISFNKNPAAQIQSSHRGKDLGFLLFDPKKKQVLTRHQQDTGCIPASTAKVATTAAAIHVLGEDFRFPTLLASRGRIKAGTLTGDLYLKGYGDPFLHARDLRQMVVALAERGITNVKGRFIFDDSLLMRSKEIDTGMDPDAAYNPGVSALSSAYNGINAHWKRTPNTKTADVFISPQLPIHTVRAARTIPWLSTRFSSDKTGAWTLRSTYKPRGRTRLPVARPALFTAHLLSYLCRIQGITLPEPEAGVMPKGTPALHRHLSKPLIDLIQITLDYSDNLMAELLLLQTIKALGANATTLPEAGAALARFYKKIMPRVDWTGLHLANGSGLTGMSRITPEQMVAFLRFALAHPLKNTSYQSLLPASGFSYSMLDRLNRDGLTYRVWAKTGTIFYAIGLAGVLHTRSGRKLLFSATYSDLILRESFVKNSRGKSRESALKKAIGWVKKKRTALDQLVAGWIEKY